MTESRLIALEITTGKLVRISDGIALSAAWSREGLRIAYVATVTRGAVSSSDRRAILATGCSWWGLDGAQREPII